MFVLNNNGDSSDERIYESVYYIPKDEVCVIYFAGEGVGDFGAGARLSDIVANEVILNIQNIPRVANYAYVYGKNTQEKTRDVQFERYNQNVLLKIPQPTPKNADKPNVTHYYITKKNLNRVFKTQIEPLFMNNLIELFKGDIPICFDIDGNIGVIRPILIQKLRDLSTRVPDPKIANLIKTQLPQKIFPYNMLLKNDYVTEIFNSAIMPRITNKFGKRLTANHAAINMRKMNFMALCHGAYVMLHLGEMMREKMRALGYSCAEIKMIQSQMLVVALNPACPLGVTDMRVISFTSAYDEKIPRSQNWLNDFLQKQLKKEKNGDWNLRPGFLSGKNGDVFYVKQRFKLADNEISDNEHNNMHYYHEHLTEEGCELMRLSQNVIISGIKNSLKQKTKLVPLPKLDELILDGKNDDQITERFTEMKRNGRKFMNDVYKHATATVHARNVKKHTGPTKIIAR